MIYIVLVNWNNASDTIACLGSLRRLETDESVRVLVCDNASTDNSVASIETWIQDEQVHNVRVIQTGGNLGFAGGNNVGLRIALADPQMTHVWLLNNDTVADSRSLDQLVATIRADSGIGICGSTLLYAHEPSKIQAVGGYYNFWLGISSHALDGTDYSAAVCQSVDADSFDYIVGASMLVSRRFLEQVGLMDETYFLYCEELDWATRAKRAGFRLGYACGSLVYHKEGATTGSSGKIERNKRSVFADQCALRSHLVYAGKFHPVRKWTVRLFYLVKALNRLRLHDTSGGCRALKAFFLVWS